MRAAEPQRDIPKNGTVVQYANFLSSLAVRSTRAVPYGKPYALPRHSLTGMAWVSDPETVADACSSSWHYSPNLRL